MDKEHKKLLTSVRSICEALELMGEDITERIAKSENRMLSHMDGRLSRDLRGVTAVQTELLAKLDRLERSQRIILDRLPEADETEGLRRRIRYLERALQDHLDNSEDDPLEAFEPDMPYDPLAAYEASRGEPGQAESARPVRSDAVSGAEPQRSARPAPPRPERPEALRFEWYDRSSRPIRPGD